MILTRVEDVMISPDTKRGERIPPGQSRTDRWPVLHHGKVPKMDIGSWTFTIFGLVDEVRTLTLEEFKALPQVKVVSDIHCVTGWSRLDNLWEGVASKVIFDLVKVGPGAKFVMVHGHGGFTANLSIKEFLEDDVLFAMRHDGRTLEPGHGAPVRLVVPRLYFWKSAKWVTGVEYVSDERPGFWERRGYHIHGDPWKEERYMDR